MTDNVQTTSAPLRCPVCGGRLQETIITVYSSREGCVDEDVYDCKPCLKMWDYYEIVYYEAEPGD